MRGESGYMSSKNTKEIVTSLTPIGLILFDCPAEVMSWPDYYQFAKDIVMEDGNLDCIPGDAILLPGTVQPTMWRFI